MKKEAKHKMLAAFAAVFCLAVLLAPAALAATPGEISVTVAQVFVNTGISAPASETFTYRLRPARPSGEDRTFTIKGTDQVDIPFSFSGAGEYTYELEAVTPPSPGYTYDQKIYTLKFIVESDLSVTALAYNRDGAKAEIQYRHSFGDLPTDPTLMVDPPVVKTVAGEPNAASVFTFELRAGDKANPMPAGSANGVKTLQITGVGKKDFGTWAYTKAGAYYYIISEKNTGERRYTYDTAVYTITDTVTSENGQLVLDRVVTNYAGRPVTSCSFINTYQGDRIVPGSDTAPASGSTNQPAPGGPKTGDDSQAALYLVLLCAAGIAAAGSAIYLLPRRRKGRAVT